MAAVAIAMSFIVAPVDASMSGFRAQAVSSVPDPTTNITPSPAYPSSCQSAPTGSACQNSAIAALNNARSVMGLTPYTLPSNFQSMTPASQFLWLSNQDRAAYGLTQITGLNAALNAAAASGVATDSDPQGPPSVEGASWTAWTANWAAGWASPLYTYYEWMYDDGYPGANADCPTSTSSGCWGHRHSTLHNFGSSVVYMGVGTGTSPQYNAPAFTELYMGLSRAVSSVTPLSMTGVKAGSIRQVSGTGRGDITGRRNDGSLWLYPNNLPTNSGGLPYSSGYQIGGGWQSFTNIATADVNCDGYSDIVATLPSGALMYYQNGMAVNAGGAPYTNGKQIGSGWQTFTKVLSADVNGDGCADLIGVKADGTLWYYPNGLAANPSGAAYSTGTQIGAGWNMFSQISLGDVNGDGRADLIGVTPSGSLYLYLNGLGAAPSGPPFTAGTVIGSGWQALSQVGLSDVSGDGYADIVATLSNGTLLLYPNNITTNAGHLPYTSGSVIGGGWTVYNLLS